jgi:CHAT domain-containing protein
MSRTPIVLFLLLLLTVVPGTLRAQEPTGDAAPAGDGPAPEPSGGTAGTKPLPPGASEAVRRAWDANAEALAALQTGRYRDGVPKAREAVTLRESALGPDREEVADSLDLLARLLERSGDLAGARAAAERALRIREATLGPNHADTAATVQFLGWLHQITGQLASARALYERARRIQEDLFGPESVAVADTLNRLGQLQLDMGEAAAAQVILQRAVQILEKQAGPNHRQTGNALVNLGRALAAVGEYDGARAAFERGLRIQERQFGPEHPSLGYALGHFGMYWERLDDHQAARQLFERALHIREKTLGPDHIHVAWILTHLSVTLRSLGDPGTALTMLGRALAIQEKAFGPNHPLVAETLRNRGRTAQMLRNFPFARNDLERALRITEQGLGPSHPRVGLILANLGGLLWVTRDTTGAVDHYERALRILRAGGYPEVRWRAANALGQLHERAGRRAEATAAYREAVTVIRDLAASLGGPQSRGQYLEAANRLAVFDNLARVLLRLHERDTSRGFELEALAALEAKKSLLVATTLAAARPKVRDPEAERVAREVAAKRGQAARLEHSLAAEQVKAPSAETSGRIQAITQELARTKGEYLGQVQALLARYPQYRAQFVDQQTVDPKAIAKLADRLPAGTLAVQYFATPETLYLFAVARGGRFQVKTQAVRQEELYDLIRQYRGLVERGAGQRLLWVDDGSEAYRRDVAPLREVTAKLSAHLLGPIEVELAGHPNLVLFPNDLLLYLPIHALVRTQADGSTRFLAETHTVSYVTQLELTDLVAPAGPGGAGQLLAMANPDGSLPAASREVRELARVNPGMTTLEGADATKLKFFELAGRHAALHLATHGVLDPQRPDRSYLLLAGDDEQSQRLTIGEIAGLSLSPHALAVLSGCETAVGEQVPGAALVTLAAAFSQAGSQSIVASLWRVSDTATRDFMVAFHRALPAEGRAGALQAAQRALIGRPETAHPYYWAAFLLFGAR